MKTNIPLIYPYYSMMKSNTKLHLVALSLFLLPIEFLGQTAPFLNWQHPLGGSGYDVASEILMTNDGGYIVTGTTASTTGDVSMNQGGMDVWVVKLNGQGEILWEQTYGGSLDDGAEALALTDDGGFIISGWTESWDGDVTGYQGGRDYWVLKLDSFGSLEWERTLGGSGQDESYSICRTNDGGYAVVGWTNSNDGDVTGFHGPSWRDIWAVKLDATGELVWQNAIGGSGTDEGFSIILDTDGGFVIAGHSGSIDGDVSMNPGPMNESNFWIVKLTSTGQVSWEKMYGGSSDDRAFSVHQTTDGGYVVTGQTWSDDGDVSDNNGSYDIWTIKLNPTGDLVWQSTVGGSDVDFSSSILETSNGHYVLAGWTESDDGDVSETIGGRDIWVVALDAFGNTSWELTLGGTNNDQAYSIVTTPDDGYALAGSTLSDDGDVSGLHSEGTPDIWVVKLSPYSYTMSATCTPDKPAIGTVPLSTSPLKICADGSSATSITVSTSGNAISTDNIRFRLTEATIDPGYSGYFQDPSLFDTSVPDQVTAQYTHPTFLNVGNLPFRTDILEAYDVDDPSQVLASIPVQFYRAPIVFMHGLGADQRTFLDMNIDLLDMYPWNGSLPSGSSLIHRADYSSTNCLSFIHNKNVVPNAIDKCVDQAVGDGYSCAKTTIVGHSMGGILPRIYLQSYNFSPYRGDVHSLITLNSPHFGTQFADWGMENCREYPIGCLLLLMSPFSPCESNIGAVRDLSVYSRQIRNLNRYPQLVTVPSRTLASDYFGDATINGLLETQLNPNSTYNGEISDLIVPLSSQLSNAGSTYTSAQWHVGSTENSEMKNTVRSLLDQDPYLTPYFIDGFQQDSLDYFGGLQLSTLPETVTITNTVSNQNHMPNDIVPLNLNLSSGISEIFLIVQGSSIDPIYTDTISVELISFQIPSLAIGELEIHVFGGDGSDWLAHDSTHIQVQSTIIPDSIAGFPKTTILPLGLNERLSVTGYFGSISGVDLQTASELTVTYDNSMISGLGDGMYQGINVGESWIVFEYLGISDSVFVSIVDEPSQLVSAFDYNLNTICVGDSIYFSNSSLGLATDQFWDFPGGIPSTSTEGDPVITYTEAGSYEVSLITEFVNGTDTLLLTDFIHVVPEPVVGITESDNSLISNATNVDYQWIDCITGNEIPTATEQEYFPLESGIYAVVISNGTCSRTSECVVWTTTDLYQRGSELGFEVVPNPTNGPISILMSRNYEQITITIADALGRTVFDDVFSSSDEIGIYLDSPPGMYFMTITADGQHQVVRVLKS